MKRYYLSAGACLMFSLNMFAQVQTGVWRSTSDNTDYHHFTRSGGGAAVYINQVSSATNRPILRLSSGTFASNQNVRFTVENNGYVGIGTTTPEANLEILNTNTIGGKWSPSLATLKLTTGATSLIADANEIYTNGTLYLGGTSETVMKVRGITNTGRSELMALSSSGSMVLGEVGALGASYHMYSKLTVEAENEHAMISILTAPGKKGYYGFGDADNDFVGGMEYAHSRNELVLRVNNHSADVLIDSEGNVGIGTETPDSKLTVKGTIHAEEVKVDLNVPGPDYVFEENYRLRSLEETKAYIEENKHLPGIPSSAEMQQNGVNLLEMNMKLLEKVEELTLYLIEQDKKLLLLSKENEQHQNEIKELRQLISEQ